MQQAIAWAEGVGAARDIPALSIPTARKVAASLSPRDATQLALLRVERHADPAWLEAAYQALLRCARARESFISDDVWSFGLEATREDRALGAVFMRAKRAGVIVKTDRVRPSVRSHLSGKPVWHSLIYGRAK